MKPFKLKTLYKKLLADTTTPVSIYLRLRDVFPNSILLESSEYHNRENSMSYVCCKPIAGVRLDKEKLESFFPDGEVYSKPVAAIQLEDEITNFRQYFEYAELPDFKFISNGLFGYFTFEAVPFFEDIQLAAPMPPSKEIPILQYHVYRYIIAIDHFKNELVIFEHLLDG